MRHVWIMWFVLLAGCTPSLPRLGNVQCGAEFEWANFVKFNNIEYIAIPGSALLQADQIGPEFARVQFRASGNVCDLGYRTQNGHAGLLDPGTPVFTIKGVPPTQRLAARWGDQWTVFERLRP